MADCALLACSGITSAPIEMVAATAPTLVSITLSQTVAMRRRAIASTPSSTQSLRMMPNLLDEYRPIRSLPGGAPGVGQKIGKLLGEPGPVELAGQLVMAAQE